VRIIHRGDTVAQTLALPQKNKHFFKVILRFPQDSNHTHGTSGIFRGWLDKATTGHMANVLLVLLLPELCYLLKAGIVVYW